MDVLFARGLSQEILSCRKGVHGMHLIKLSGKSITQDHLDQHQALLQLLLSNDGQRDKKNFVDAFLTLNVKMERALATAAKEHLWADSEAEKLSHLWGYCLKAVKRKGFTRSYSLRELKKTALPCYTASFVDEACIPDCPFLGISDDEMQASDGEMQERNDSREALIVSSDEEQVSEVMAQTETRRMSIRRKSKPDGYYADCPVPIPRFATVGPDLSRTGLYKMQVAILERQRQRHESKATQVLEIDKGPKAKKQKGSMKKGPMKKIIQKKVLMKKNIQKTDTKTHGGDVAGGSKQRSQSKGGAWLQVLPGAVRVKAKEERGCKFWQVFDNGKAVIQVTQKSYGTSAITLANELAAMWRSGRPIEDLRQYKLSFRE
mgnify:CR=1 FL=1